MLIVILALTMSDWGRRTVVYSHKDLSKLISGILYDSRMTHKEACLIELKALLKSMSTRKNHFLRRWVSLVRPYNLQALMSVLLSWRNPPLAGVTISHTPDIIVGFLFPYLG